MKYYRYFRTRFTGVAMLFLLVVGFATPVQAGELKLVVQLIWGTNDKESPDRNHKPVDPKVAKKLKKLPFKWEYYYQVCSHNISVKKGETHTKKLSKECEIKVRNLGDDKVEVQLFGKGELVSTISQSITKDEFLVTGGNAANLTAWFVVMRQSE